MRCEERRERVTMQVLGTCIAQQRHQHGVDKLDDAIPLQETDAL
jgi:hypothetical protein